ncbi:unnamed protein product [Rotaria sp. Silwood1]|nr:unnamed protein product [Rotaria sp. Silwood1]
MDSQIALSDKYTIPQLDLGTCRNEPQKVQNIVKEAILNCDHPLIDTAWIYQNEHEVGNGIHEAIEQSQGQIKREDLFITTKLWNQHHTPEEVEWALRDSLKKLRLDYVDLYLIHWPVAFKNMPENIWSQNEDEKTRYFAENVTLCDSWKAMENLVDLKLTRSIGISNFNESEIKEIVKIARIKPILHQIELHPYCNQHNMHQYCIKHNISIISYCPLSNLKRENEHDEDVSALYNPIIQEIAKSKHKTTAQIILRWHLQNGLIVIPETTTSEKLIEYSDLFDFALCDHEMCQIDQLGDTNRRRIISPLFRPPNNKPILMVEYENYYHM